MSIVEMPPFKVTSGQTNARVQVNLIIENTGFGRVVNNEVRDFAIVLKGEGTERDITNNCPDIVSGRIKLYGKEQERSIRCSLVLPFSETAVSYIVEAEMGYTYYIDTNPLAVRVKGGTGTSSTTVITYRQPASLQNEPIGDWWDDIVDICVDKWGLRDPYFIAAIVKKESWFDASAFNAGEKQAWEAYQSGQTTVKPWHEEYYGKGLMQITGPWIAGVPRPSTFEWQYNMPPEAIQTQAPVMTDAYNGRQNLDRGCWYMKALLNHYGNDQYKAATAYRFGWQGTDAGSFDPYDNNYVNDVFRYKSEYLQNVGYTENQFPSRP
ncbi:TPA: transglycosylase SLT domain-containing protein [archaeon]|nr:transglycosylase SLT domain-containing protein [Candidatus Naiadarchaeales archaeon SRR2090153.bin1042]